MTTKISTDNIQQDTLELLTGGVGVTVYDTIAELPLTGVEDGAQAFVIGNNRLYLWTGTGWFNIALLNTSPVITTGPQASYRLARDGDPTVLTLVANDPEGFPITWSYEVTSGTAGNTAVITQSNNVFTITPSTNTADIGTFQITFTASDGVNLAAAASTFTLAFSAADQHYNRSIVLTTTSINNANNNTFIDGSNNSFTITKAGNATQGTFSPYSPAGWSGYFDGTGDMLVVPASADMAPLTGDFTYECWVYPASTAVSYRALFGIDNYGGSTPFRMYQYGTNFEFWYTGSLNIAATGIQANVWYHVAITRSSGVLRLFVNGVQAGSNVTSTLNYPSSIFRIGMDSGGLYPFIGHISNMRAVKGTALYTANFTPPTQPLTAIANTSLLTLQDNRFKDNSTNNFAITRNGDTRITPFSPFSPQDLYDPIANGGSAYFDGTGDFLTIPDSTQFRIGTNSFTIDGWLYKTIDTTDQTVISIGPNNSSGYGLFFYTTAGRTILALGTGGSGATVLADTTAFPLNQWTHFALVRNGTALALYVNGVSKATTTWATSWNPSGGQVTSIGQWVDATSFRYGPGHMSDIRVVNGTALYTANFTPPTAPTTAVANTSLLLNFTNAGIFDETGKIVLETVGDAKVNTSVVKYGTGSMAFDGTGDYLVIPANILTYLSDRQFTIEAWVYPIANNGTVAGRRSDVAARGLLFAFNANNNLRFWAGDSDVNTWNVQLTSPNAYNLNQWYHVAATRNSSNVFTLWVDGVAVANATSSFTIADDTTALQIGSIDSGGGPFNGHISDFRLTQDVARYTANFTPPTAKLGFNNDE